MFKIGDKIRVNKKRSDYSIVTNWLKEHKLDPDGIYTVSRLDGDSHIVFCKEMHDSSGYNVGGWMHYRFELVKYDIESLEEAIATNTLAKFIKAAIT